MVLWLHIFLECLFRHFCILHRFGIVVICVKCIAHIHVILCNSTIKSFWYAMAKVTLIKRNFMFEYFELDIYYRNTLLWKIKTTVFTHSKTVFIPLRRLKFACPSNLRYAMSFRRCWHTLIRNAFLLHIPIIFC